MNTQEKRLVVDFVSWKKRFLRLASNFCRCLSKNQCDYLVDSMHNSLCRVESRAKNAEKEDEALNAASAEMTTIAHDMYMFTIDDFSDLSSSAWYDWVQSVKQKLLKEFIFWIDKDGELC